MRIGLLTACRGRKREALCASCVAIGQDQHRGYGGWGTGNILANIGKWVAADKPDVVLLMIGINDGGSADARTNLERIVRRLCGASKAPSPARSSGRF